MYVCMYEACVCNCALSPMFEVLGDELDKQSVYVCMYACMFVCMLGDEVYTKTQTYTQEESNNRQQDSSSMHTLTCKIVVVKN